MDATRFIKFVVARHRVYLARKGGLSLWTLDNILATYRFCNVYRELDRVTIYIREKYQGDSPQLWFDLVVARLINNPDTLEELPVYSKSGWNPRGFVHTLHRRADAGHRVFNPAYIVSTNGIAMPKPEYLAERVLTPLWENQGGLSAGPRRSLERYHLLLQQYQGLGSFMSAQVVADLKNTPLQPLREARDWWTWAAPGPGSLRGMNRLLGRGGVKTMPPGPSWLTHVQRLREQLNDARPEGWKMFCAQDTQNCLCEFDKYERVRLGEGVPKQLFTPSNK
jgi:hypothetical protein